jgi:hypothetical protein
MGNHPVIDLMVISPDGTQFAVDVKGQYRRNFWPVRQKATTEKLFYVLAFVPEDRENSFFILTQDQANEGIQIELEYAKSIRKKKGLAGEPPEFPGIDSKFAERFKDKWDSLPK